MGQGPHLAPRDLREGRRAVPDRGEENDEIVDRAAEGRPEQDPERAGQVPELRRQDGSDQGPRGGDRGEVMAEQHELVGLDEIAAVRLGDRGDRPGGIDARDLGGDERDVVTVGEGVEDDRRERQDEGVHSE